MGNDMHEEPQFMDSPGRFAGDISKIRPEEGSDGGTKRFICALAVAIVWCIVRIGCLTERVQALEEKKPPVKEERRKCCHVGGFTMHPPRIVNTLECDVDVIDTINVSAPRSGDWITTEMRY